MEPNVICIVGMHRSGTSMVAQLLHRCGLDLGPEEKWLKADAANPLGHFEHRGFLDIDRKLLKFFGATWSKPPVLRKGWHLDPRLQSLHDEAKALAATFEGKSPWGWKEPRACLFLPFWRRVIPNMRFVICIRNPLDVARSLEKRNRMALHAGASLWYRYLMSALEDTEGCPRIFTFFEDFFERGSKEIERLLDFCGLPLPDDPSKLKSAVSSELRHHTGSPRSLLEEPAVPPACKYFYLGLCAVLSPQHPSESRGEEENSLNVAALVRSFGTARTGKESLPPAAPASARSGTARAKAGLKKLLSSLRASVEE